MSKQVDWPYVINLGNSIIGVSVLAMPFCFKECGLFLGMLLLLGSAWLTGVSCNLLMKAAISSKKRSYEFLALHVLGRLGKLTVEMSIIGLLLGTCVAFYVVIGDLGPAIISKMFNIENTPNLRSGFMITIGLFVALPLGLLKNVESLSNISAISLGFYCVFVAEVFSAAFPNLWSGVWVSKVVLWNPEGVFKCLPIFALAFGCQTQLFVMYDALPEPSLSRMTSISKNAVSLCTGVYLCVGYFGCVAFCEEEVAGDILMNFRPTIFSEAVKLGFVLSVAVSFPLVIFPCRTSIHSLIFAKTGVHENFGGSPHVTEFQFKLITVFIVVISLIIGILIPNIEFVLAITGATMGALICYIFPAVIFISLMSMSSTQSKSTAQVVLFLGVTILLASTYTTLYAEERGSSSSVVKIPVPHDHIDSGEININIPGKEKEVLLAHNEKTNDDKDNKPPDKGSLIDGKSDTKSEQAGVKKAEEAEKRQEPPIPHAPLDTEEHKEKEKDAVEHVDEKKDPKTKNDAEADDTKKDETDAVNDKAGIQTKEVKPETEKKTEKGKEVGDNEGEKPGGKEGEKEIKGDKEGNKGEKNDGEAGKLLEELKAQRVEQRDLINQQKAIIAELQKHKDEAHPKVEVAGNPQPQPQGNAPLDALQDNQVVPANVQQNEHGFAQNLPPQPMANQGQQILKQAQQVPVQNVNQVNVPIQQNQQNVPIQQNQQNVPIEQNQQNVPIQQNQQNVPMQQKQAPFIPRNIPVQPNVNTGNKPIISDRIGDVDPVAKQLLMNPKQNINNLDQKKNINLDQIIHKHVENQPIEKVAHGG